MTKDELFIINKRFKLLSILDRYIKRGWESIPPFFIFDNIVYFYPQYEINLNFDKCCINSKNISLIKEYTLNYDDYYNFLVKIKRVYNETEIIDNDNSTEISCIDYKDEYLKFLLFISDEIIDYLPEDINVINILYALKNVLYLTSYSVIIHIPELNITNSNKIEHKLRGLFLRFKFVGFTLDLPYIARNIYTQGEVKAKYKYSHVNSFSDPLTYSHNFCYGSNALIPSSKKSYNDEATILKNNIARSLNKSFIQKPFDEEQYSKLSFYLQNYIITFINYLSWESIEGGPYVKLANCSSKELDFKKDCSYNATQGILNSVVKIINPKLKLLFEEMFRYFIYNELLTFGIIENEKVGVITNNIDLTNYCYSFLKMNESFINENHLYDTIVYYKTNVFGEKFYASKLNNTALNESYNNLLDRTGDIYFNNSYVKGELFKETATYDFLETVNPLFIEAFLNFMNLKLLNLCLIETNKNLTKPQLIINLND